MLDAGASRLLEVRITRKCHPAPGGGQVEAVRDLSLAIFPGEILCLMGPSGCGKTTILRILLGLDRAFEGEVEPDPARLRVGMVFQEPRLLPWRTVEDNVRLVLPPGDRKRDLDELLRNAGIEPWRAHYPGELSLGLARRVSLARALANAPGLLVLDEPFVSLDDYAATELRNLVMAAGERHGMAVLLVTHNIREAVALADRIVLLTPRPARFLGEVVLSRLRSARSVMWVEEQRSALCARFPTILS